MLTDAPPALASSDASDANQAEFKDSIRKTVVNQLTKLRKEKIVKLKDDEFKTIAKKLTDSILERELIKHKERKLAIPKSMSSSTAEKIRGHVTEYAKKRGSSKDKDKAKAKRPSSSKRPSSGSSSKRPNKRPATNRNAPAKA